MEDAPARVAAGKAAGCTVIGITSTHQRSQLADADACVSSLSELRRFLTELLSDGGLS
ncbi:hypothetical protein ABT009_34170 [Streptomyces sp. NPDC002896]|uniref:hypothetical protein n=1 Tax=Streptomyces sp. NPDC002896 TaxID=3154438 RepID=UPI00331B9B2A